jgi:uncharacterized protein YjeT (DUF2065 family)
MNSLIEAAVAMLVLVTGISQIYGRHVWAAYYQALGIRGGNGLRIHGVLTLSVGALIAGFHNIWQGPPIMITVMGWLLLAEGIICLFFPRFGIISLGLMDHEGKSRSIFFTGVLLVIVAGALLATMFFGQPVSAG